MRPRASAGGELADNVWSMDTPPPDPVKMLEKWEEWERGQIAPGRLIADLKQLGLPALLASVAADR